MDREDVPEAIGSIPPYLSEIGRQRTAGLSPGGGLSKPLASHVAGPRIPDRGHLSIHEGFPWHPRVGPKGRTSLARGAAARALSPLRYLQTSVQER